MQKPAGLDLETTQIVQTMGFIQNQTSFCSLTKHLLALLVSAPIWNAVGLNIILQTCSREQ